MSFKVIAVVTNKSFKNSYAKLSGGIKEWKLYQKLRLKNRTQHQNSDLNLQRNNIRRNENWEKTNAIIRQSDYNYFNVHMR
jgi:hypothetical protein